LLTALFQIKNYTALQVIRYLGVGQIIAEMMTMMDGSRATMTAVTFVT